MAGFTFNLKPLPGIAIDLGVNPQIAVGVVQLKKDESFFEKRLFLLRNNGRTKQQTYCRAHTRQLHRIFHIIYSLVVYGVRTAVLL